jgi:Flp pilus assembly protein TadG
MHRSRDERGAVAILVALLMVLLLSLAAMAVDLGRAYVERQEVQRVADFAALAGAAGNNLPGTTPGHCDYGERAAATDQAVVDVAAYLAESPTPGALVDCSLNNGEVFYGTINPDASGSGVELIFDPTSSPSSARTARSTSGSRR